MRQRDFSLFTFHFSLFTKQSLPPCCPHHPDNIESQPEQYALKLAFIMYIYLTVPYQRGSSKSSDY